MLGGVTRRAGLSTTRGVGRLWGIVSGAAAEGAVSTVEPQALSFQESGSFQTLLHKSCSRSTSLRTSRLYCTTQEANPSSRAHVQSLFQNSQPRSLQTERPYLAVEANDKGIIGKFVLKVGGYYSRESQLVRGSNSLLKMLLDHCEESGIREALRLENDFRTRHAFVSLHVWMVLRRLRGAGADGKSFSQFLYDNFQHEVEMSVHREGVRVRLSKWLRQLEDIFFGAAKAYDDAIDNHTEDFAEVLNRNIYSGKGDRRYCQALARYAIRELVSLSLTDDQAILNGEVKFSSGTK